MACFAVCHSFAACQAAYALVAGGCDCPLPPAAGLSNNDVIALRVLRIYGESEL